MIQQRVKKFGSLKMRDIDLQNMILREKRNIGDINEIESKSLESIESSKEYIDKYERAILTPFNEENETTVQGVYSPGFSKNSDDIISKISLEKLRNHTDQDVIANKDQDPFAHSRYIQNQTNFSLNNT